MTWFKVDDGFYDHPKFQDVPNAAVGLWVKAGAWCAKHNTYGYLTKKRARSLGGTKGQIRALVDAGVWIATGDGYQFEHWRKSQDGNYRRNIRKSVREAVMARDNYRCVWCGATDNLSLDHIVPYRLNGADTIENLRVLCMPCNQGREKGANYAVV